jgi:hypothetical protein
MLSGIYAELLLHCANLRRRIPVDLSLGTFVP